MKLEYGFMAIALLYVITLLSSWFPPQKQFEMCIWMIMRLPFLSIPNVADMMENELYGHLLCASGIIVLMSSAYITSYRIRKIREGKK